MDLSLPEAHCIAAVKELQNTAVDKLRANALFQQTGIASLKVRVPATEFGTQLLSVEVNLNDNAQVLENLIISKLKLESGRVKLIVAGRVLSSLQPLNQQNIVNNQQILGLVSCNGQSSDVDYDHAAKVKRDAQLLVNDKYSSYMQMEDQDGNPIYLPENERKALMLGLALYEKGRAALKKENYREALPLLLEADEEFATCQSKLLESVDNYALLNLDIVWCYLCLKSLTQLPDAERRLKICEDSFQRSYGSDFNRVISLKTRAGNERALMMRLHLLQAVLYYHMNRRNEAETMFALAESELTRLEVDGVSLTSLVEMGYDVSEARIALRAAENNVDAAINHILERREQKATARKKANENRKLLGKNFSHGSINPNSVKCLMEMGFDQNLAAIALEECNGDVEQAVQMIQERGDVLRQKYIQRVAANSAEDILSNLVNLGFDLEIAKHALLNSNNELMAAVDYLFKMQQDGTYDAVVASLQLPSASTSAHTDGASSSQSSEQPNIAKVLQMAKDTVKQKVDADEAFRRFREGLTQENDEEYLDLPLDIEKQLLVEYKRLLGS